MILFEFWLIGGVCVCVWHSNYGTKVIRELSFKHQSDYYVKKMSTGYYDHKPGHQQKQQQQRFSRKQQMMIWTKKKKMTSD